MNEYKVLGASERNLKAIEMALSNNGSISTNGSVKADFHYKEEVKADAEIELPSGMCLLISNNGVLSGIPISAGVFYTDGLSSFIFKPVRNC